MGVGSGCGRVWGRAEKACAFSFQVTHSFSTAKKIILIAVRECTGAGGTQNAPAHFCFLTRHAPLSLKHKAILDAHVYTLGCAFRQFRTVKPKRMMDMMACD